jgi:TatA/E family protein of Tat protein translocase
MQIHALAFFGNLAGPDMLIILGVALLIFGRRLPEVGKNLGKTIVEFKKGLSGREGEDQPPEEPADHVPVNRNLSKPQGRIASGPSGGTARKSLPTTEEV